MYLINLINPIVFGKQLLNYSDVLNMFCPNMKISDHTMEWNDLLDYVFFVKYHLGAFKAWLNIFLTSRRACCNCFGSLHLTLGKTAVNR